jgi:hypothetical protein
MMSRAQVDLNLLISLNQGTSISTFLPIKPDAAADNNTECGRTIIEELNGTLTNCAGSAISLENHSENVFLYFTKASCEHCSEFTPKLKEAFSQQTSHTFTLIVVSLDGDPQQLATTKQSCEGAWPLVAPESDARANAITKLTGNYGVSGVPCLVSLRSENNTWFIRNLNAVHTLLVGKPFPYVMDPKYLSSTETKVS